MGKMWDKSVGLKESAGGYVELVRLGLALVGPVLVLATIIRD